MLFVNGLTVTLLPMQMHKPAKNLLTQQKLETSNVNGIGGTRT